MRPWIALALVSALVAAGCVGGGRPAEPEPTSPEPSAGPEPLVPTPTPTAAPPAPAPKPSARFLLTGDTGTGSEAQYKVAATMASVCAARGCDFMAILGDVIYEIGVSDPYDPQFETKFELPYAALDLPIYTVLGNHDNSNDPLSSALAIDAGIGHWYESGNHMVAYHYRTDRLSEKWQMPARYYSFRVGDAEFFALDSNTMMYLNLPATTNPQAYQDALEQGDWFDAAVAASDAPWKFTLAHHPYVSNGEHGDAGHYDDQDAGPLGEQAAPGLRGDGVKMFFDDHVCASGAIDMHLAGHDHDLQWLKPVPTCGATEFIVSGAGAKSRELEEDPAEDAWFGQGGVQGFFWVEVFPEAVHALVFDEEGNVLFERTLNKPA